MFFVYQTDENHEATLPPILPDQHVVIHLV